MRTGGLGARSSAFTRRVYGKLLIFFSLSYSVKTTCTRRGVTLFQSRKAWELLPISLLLRPQALTTQHKNCEYNARTVFFMERSFRMH